VHPILSRAGDSINVVPAEVVLEAIVRGATYSAIEDAERKVDRALRAGAMAVGGSVEIDTLPGYMPLRVDESLVQLFKSNALALVGEAHWAELGPVDASTDAGDLSHVLPVLHPGHGGWTGTNHAPDFMVSDEQTAYITPAKALAWTIVDLLAGDGARARDVLDHFQPQLTRAQYLEHMRRLTRHEVANYRENATP
jgi:metal-dependent amidase/aminoacylase/carboxypeptidase family protein